MSVEIPPATTTRPVVISVSQATRPFGSSARTASRTVSEIWSAILSGCPSVTDSEVNEKVRAAMRRRRLLDLEERGEGSLAAPDLRVGEEAVQRREVGLDVRRNVLAAELGEALDQRDRVLEVEVEEAARRV